MSMQRHSPHSRYGVHPGPPARAARCERVARLLEFLQQHPTWRVQHLAETLGVHPMTIRNDLADLVRQGVVERGFGTVTFKRPEAVTTLPAKHRRDQLLSQLSRHEPQSVRELARSLGVHGITVRRDLEQLTALGLIERYAGLVRRASLPPDLPHTFRLYLHHPGKVQIAQRALSLIEDGEHIALDASTTALCLARLLVGRDVTVVTTGLDAAHLLAELKVPVTLLGGQLHPGSRSFHHAPDHPGLRMRIDKVFFSCAGLSSGGVLTEMHPGEVEAKQNLLRHARWRVSMIDHTKYGQSASWRLIRLQEVQVLISDRQLPLTLPDGVTFCAADQEI